jgi:hypothetical protein
MGHKGCPIIHMEGQVGLRKKDLVGLLDTPILLAGFKNNTSYSLYLGGEQTVARGKKEAAQEIYLLM